MLRFIDDSLPRRDCRALPCLVGVTLEWPRGCLSSSSTVSAHPLTPGTRPLPQLSIRRYGYDAPRLLREHQWESGREDLGDGGFQERFGSISPTSRVASTCSPSRSTRPPGRPASLKVVIDAIKQFTGAPEVILVGHSLGGLAARSYMQGTGHYCNGIPIPAVRP